MREKIGKQSVSRWPWDAVVLLLALAASLIYFQYATLDKFSALRPAVKYPAFEYFLQAVERSVPLNFGDLIAAILILALSAALVVAEIWKKRLSVLLDELFRTETRTLLALVLSGFVLVRFYFARGDLSWAADTSVHTVYAWIASRAFAQGEFPIWTNYFCAGSPYLQFYGFLFFYIAGLTDLVFRDIHLSVKLVMAGAHVLSGVGMYLFVRTLTGSRPAGFLAGLAYVLSFWHTQQVLVMGRLPLSVFYALLPFPFYFFEQLLLRSYRLPAAIGGALTLGLLAFTHPGYAFWATVLVVVYIALRLWSEGYRQIIPVAGGHSLLLLAGGLVFGAYLTLPMWIERQHTALRFQKLLSHVPDPTWDQLLFWSNFRFPLVAIETTHWYGGYVGLSLFLLAVAGLASFVLPGRLRMSASLAGGACFIISLILVFGYRWPLIRDLEAVQVFNAGRYLLFVVFFLSAMAGIGALTLTRLRHLKSGGNLFTILLFVVLLDLGSTTFQHPYIPGGLTFFPRQTQESLQKEASRYHDGELPGYRVFHATGNVYRFIALSWIPVETGMTEFLGVYTERPLGVLAFGEPFEKLLNPLVEGVSDPVDLLSVEKVDVVAAGLHLLNTKYMFAYRPEKGGTWNWTLPAPSPIVVSARVVGWDHPVRKEEGPQRQEEFENLVRSMGLNTEENRSERILLANYEGERDLGTTPTVELLDHRVWNQRVEMRVRVSSASFARLAYAYYPYLKVSVDGKEVVPFQTAGRFIALELEEGEHRVVLEPVLSPLRRALLALDIVLLAAGALVYVRHRIRPRLPSQP